MKSAIVTGANGFVGRYLVDELIHRGYRVIAVVRENDRKISFLQDKSSLIVPCDLANYTQLATKIPEGEYTYFFHLAWSGSSGAARADYKLQLANAATSVDAAIAASSLGCQRFIGAGSVTELMYGPYLAQDGSSPDMVTCYAVGKIAAEYMCRCVSEEKKIDFLWGYLSNFYGVGDPTQNFINFVSQSYLQGKMPALTSGSQHADFLYVSDVARALANMAEKGVAGASYYVGYGAPQPLKHYVEIIHAYIAPQVDTGLGTKDFHGLDIAFDKIDMGKLTRDTGFTPEIPFEEGIKRTVAWLKQQKDSREGIIS